MKIVVTQNVELKIDFPSKTCFLDVQPYAT